MKKRPELAHFLKKPENSLISTKKWLNLQNKNCHQEAYCDANVDQWLVTSKTRSNVF